MPFKKLNIYAVVSVRTNMQNYDVFEGWKLDKLKELKIVPEVYDSCSNSMHVSN